jgi:hypothetical protein
LAPLSSSTCISRRLLLSASSFSGVLPWLFLISMLLSYSGAIASTTRCRHRLHAKCSGVLPLLSGAINKRVRSSSLDTSDRICANDGSLPLAAARCSGVKPRRSFANRSSALPSLESCGSMVILPHSDAYNCAYHHQHPIVRWTDG